MSKKEWKNKQEVVLVSPEGKMPPNAVDIEEVVLGAVMLEGDALERVIVDFTEDLFYKEAHKLIARTIIKLFRKDEPVDILTVVNLLQQNKELELVGGAFYITSLTNRVASGGNLEFHIKILQEKHLERFILKTCGETLNKIYNNNEDVFLVFSEMQQALDNGIKGVLKYDIERIDKIHNEVIIESIRVNETGISGGVPTCLRAVDAVTNGWQKTDLIIWAGSTSMGKTASAVCVAINPSLENNTPVAIFSLEMSKEQLVGRIQSIISGVNVSKIVKKQLTKSDIAQIEKTCIKLYTTPIYIDDTPNISLTELKSKCRKLVRENKVELVVIDYLQLMRSGLNISVREQEVAEISRSLKALAKELNIPIIALSQLNRSNSGRQDKKPILSDLRESGAIEQDADMVVFCFRPEYYGIEQYEVGGKTFDAKGLFMLIIAKHRNGELGEIPLRFIHEQTKITNYDYENYNMQQPSGETKLEPVEFTEEKTKTIAPNNDFENEKPDLEGKDYPF